MAELLHIRRCTMLLFFLELEYGPLEGVKEDHFTLCLAIYFWNLEFRKLDLINRTTGSSSFSFRFRFMDRSFTTPASFTGDFWVAGFGVVYLVTKVPLGSPHYFAPLTLMEVIKDANDQN
jgi:hypothetical protein